MARLAGRLAVALFAIASALAVSASAQDFQRSYKVTPSSTVAIRNVSGDVRIVGYDGDAVVVEAYIDGRDRDRVDVEDRSSGDDVDVRARYPRNCNCDASVRFEVKVPRAIAVRSLEAATASGNIEISAASGRVRAASASGNVSVREHEGSVHVSTASGDIRVTGVAGTVTAECASGNIDVDITRLAGSEEMSFSTASGDVTVRVPAGTGASVDAETISGEISTDFNLSVEKPRYGPGAHARGSIGDGSTRIRMRTVSGNVELRSN